MSNWALRLITSIIAIPILYIVFRYGGPLFVVLITAVGIVAILEYFRLLDRTDLSIEKYIGVLGVVILPLGAFYGYMYLGLGFTCMVLLVLLSQLLKDDLTDCIYRISVTVLGIAYVGWFVSHAVLIRNLGSSHDTKELNTLYENVSDVGFFYIVLVVAVTFLNDTGAYYVGKFIGKHKLVPSISPGKTIEGTLGGIVSSIITAVVVNIIFGAPVSYLFVVTFGLLIAVLAVIGDLAESSIKRGSGVKDTGEILPGHGGVLDRIDSLLFVLPFSYYYILLWVGGGERIVGS